jgi:hypothetical protein
MLNQFPDQRLEYINCQHSDQIAQAAADRSVGRRTVHGERSFTGLHLHFGTLMIVIGCSPCEEDTLRHHATHS